MYPRIHEKILIKTSGRLPINGRNSIDFIAEEIGKRVGWGVLSNKNLKLSGSLEEKEAFEERLMMVEEALKMLDWNGRTPFLLINLKEIEGRAPVDAAVGSLYGKLCPKEIRDNFGVRLSKALQVSSAPCKVIRQELYPGHPSLLEFKRRFGEKLLIVQVELSRKLRELFTEEVVSSLILTISGVLRRL